MVGLLNNTGRATAWTGAVFEGDVWNFQLGSRPVCEHIPGPNFGDPEKLIWVYACGKVNGSEQPVVEAWPISRVWKHRDRFNKVGGAHYSFQHPEMYARKVVLLQVLKYMPRSIELNNAIVASDAAEMNMTTKVDDGVIIEMPIEEPEPPAPNLPKAPAKGKAAASNAAVTPLRAKLDEHPGITLADVSAWAVTKGDLSNEQVLERWEEFISDQRGE